MGEGIEAELNALERDIGSLKIVYERFFNGAVKLPPLKERQRIEAVLRRLDGPGIDRAADRFRFQTIQGRFTAYCEMWAKRLAAREEGRTAGMGAPLPRPAVPKAGSDAAAPPSVQEAGRVDFTPLFERYRSARAALGEDVSGLRYERFAELVVKQAEEIRRRTGTARLAFEVRTEGGKVRLVGRPAPAKGSSSP